MSDKPQYEISQWLQILREPWRLRAIKEAKIADIGALDGLIKGLRGKAPSFPKAICAAFDWCDSKDKYVFWEHVTTHPKDFVQKKYHYLLNQ